MSHKLLFIVFILSFTNFSFAQVRATTESGNKVLLFDNGTWQYEEKQAVAKADSAPVTEVVAVVAIKVDSSRTIATEPKELFYLESPRLVRYFGESGGKIRCKLSCSNNLGEVKIHFVWEFPVIDCERYFGWFKEGTKVTFKMDDGQEVVLFMGDESTLKRFERSNYSMISNATLPLTSIQITSLSEQRLLKMEVEWKKNPEEYDIEQSRFLMDTLPTIF